MKGVGLGGKDAHRRRLLGDTGGPPDICLDSLAPPLGTTSGLRGRRVEARRWRRRHFVPNACRPGLTPPTHMVPPAHWTLDAAHRNCISSCSSRALVASS